MKVSKISKQCISILSSEYLKNSSEARVMIHEDSRYNSNVDKPFAISPSFNICDTCCFIKIIKINDWEFIFRFFLNKNEAKSLPKTYFTSICNNISEILKKLGNLIQVSKQMKTQDKKSSSSK